MKLEFEQQLRAKDTELLFAKKTITGQYSIEALSENGNTIEYGTYSPEILTSLFGKEYADVIVKRANLDERIRLTKEDFPSLPDVTKNPEFRKELLMDAASAWGYTNNSQEAAFMLPNGKMLDFSDKIYDECAMNQRNNDHNTIQSGISHFMELGAIRLLPEVGGFELVFKPTKEQIEALKNYLAGSEFAKEEGTFVAISQNCYRVGRNEIAALEFPVGTNPDEIFKKIGTYNLNEAPKTDFNDKDYIKNRLSFLSDELIDNKGYTTEDLIETATKIINDHGFELRYSKDNNEFVLSDSQGNGTDALNSFNNCSLQDVIRNIYLNYDQSKIIKLENKINNGDCVLLEDKDLLLYTFSNNPFVLKELEQISPSSMLDRGYDIDVEASVVSEI